MPSKPNSVNKLARFPKNRFRSYSPGYFLFIQEIDREFVQRHSESLFPFCENDLRLGDDSGFAAELRGEGNSVGIRIKNRPGLNLDCFWTDETLDKNVEKLWEDSEWFVKHVKNSGVIFFPRAGLVPRIVLRTMYKTCPKTLMEFYRLWLEISKFAGNNSINDHPIEGSRGG